MIKQNKKLFTVKMSFKRDQSNNTIKFGTELCFTNQQNQKDWVKTGHRN